MREDSGGNYSRGCNCTNRRYREQAAGFATGPRPVVMSEHNDEGVHDLSEWENILYCKVVKNKSPLEMV